MIKVTLPDGSQREYDAGTTALDVAKSISEGLARNVLAAEVNGEVWDATRVLPETASLNLLTWRDDKGKMAFWHSTAHLMAEALEELYPGVKFWVGPPVEDGYYYDVDLGDTAISTEDFKKIEDKMMELARQKNSYERKEMSKADAIAHFKEKEDEYKLDLLEGLEDGTITFYTQGNFTDLCRGPHIPNTGFIKAVKLMKVGGAYFKGDENEKQLTRLYGISFPKAGELKDYLHMLEEAKKRDHRKLGKEMGLFAFSQNVGSGLPMWLPKGTQLRQRLVDFLTKAQVESGYQQVVTPHIGAKQLYVTSGHYAKYGEDSFRPIATPREGEEFFLRPMNCPHHCEIFKAMPRSYKELPLRLAEFGTVYRYEQQGELHGLTRVRGFTQDDAHIFCTADQVKEEFVKVIDLVMMVLSALDFKEYIAQVSLRDPEDAKKPEDQRKYIGSDENWEKAETAIQEAAKERGLNTVIEYGEAAFYGPKLDFMVKDAIGRKWQLGTIQVDYNLPERFKLEYTGADNAKHRPVMIHRAPFGSLERFVAVLIEHCAGKFPLWLTPDQCAVLPLSDRLNESAEEILNSLKNYDIRGFVDDRTESIGKKIAETEVKKVPFMLIVGDKEVESNTVSVRKQGEGDLGSMTLAEFAKVVEDEIAADFASKESN